jgi:D-xylose transport system ATP-binding protein
MKFVSAILKPYALRIVRIRSIVISATASMLERSLLSLKGVSKSFGAVQALTNVDFELLSGEVMALVGDNGAGKSTLIKGIAGIYPFDEGEIFFNGNPVHLLEPRHAGKLGIEIVYQDLAFANNLDVVANMFLGREVVNPLLRLDEAGMERTCIETLDSLAVTSLHSVRQPVAELSGGQRQAIAVARAVMWDSRIVIMDEPTAALGLVQTRQVLDLVKQLKLRGLGVVMISHNLQEVFEVSDRITVLRLGRREHVFTTSDTTQQQIVETMTMGYTS